MIFLGFVESGMTPSVSSLLLASSSAQVWILLPPCQSSSLFTFLPRKNKDSRSIGLISVRDAGRKQATKETPVHDRLPPLSLRRRLRRILVQKPPGRGVIWAFVSMALRCHGSSRDGVSDADDCRWWAEERHCGLCALAESGD